MKNEERISITKLIIKATITSILVLLFFSFLLFLSAGSLKYWNTWIVIGIWFLMYLFLNIYFVIKDPGLIQKRLKIKEKEKVQKIFQIFYYASFIITFIIAGLDFRYNWSDVPVWLVIVAAVVMISGAYMIFIVMKQNSYVSRAVEIQESQKLIDSGLYSVVRHPMYLSAIIIYIAMPLVLGSLYALISLVIIFSSLILRIMNEEKVLKNDLSGYKDYMQKVKYRLIPFIW